MIKKIKTKDKPITKKNKDKEIIVLNKKETKKSRDKKQEKKEGKKKTTSEKKGSSFDQKTDKEAGTERYFEAVGRRKKATARVRLYTKKSSDKSTGDKAVIIINEKPHTKYFDTPSLIEKVELPFRKLKSLNRFKATVRVKGGGISGQADAIRHGLARALIIFDSNFLKKMKKMGFLTRDSRVKERKKYGLKKARKAPQWSKR